MENNITVRGIHIAVHGLAALGVDDGVFHQVYEHLLDEHGIHGNHQKVVRHFHLNLSHRVSPPVP